MWDTDRDYPDIAVVRRYSLDSGSAHPSRRRDGMASGIYEKTLHGMGRESEMELVYFTAEIFRDSDASLVLEKDGGNDPPKTRRTASRSVAVISEASPSMTHTRRYRARYECPRYMGDFCTDT